MEDFVDARGLSCPGPVMRTLNVIKKMNQGKLIILVDTETAKENVIRASQAHGWKLKSVEDTEEGLRITIEKV